VTGDASSTVVKFYNGVSLLVTYTIPDGGLLSWNLAQYNANNTQFPKPFASDVTSIKVTTTTASSTLTGVATIIV
jgi:hypothetical protein